MKQLLGDAQQRIVFRAQVPFMSMYVTDTVWVTKMFPFFETRYRATVILHSVFVSVPFYIRVFTAVSAF